MEIMERSSYLTDDLRVVLQDLWVIRNPIVYFRT
jgi:hypothetical protein